MTTQIFTRLAMTATTTLVAAGVVTALPEAAHAATVSTTYGDITTITGTYLELSSQLEAQPWYQELLDANQIATEVGVGFNVTPNQSGNFEFGPFFATRLIGGGSVASVQTLRGKSLTTGIAPNDVVGFSVADNVKYTWAVQATSVPTPIPTPALLPGLIGMGVAALRKRKQEAEAEA